MTTKEQIATLKEQLWEIGERVDAIEKAMEPLADPQPSLMEELLESSERYIFTLLLKYLEENIPTFSMAEFRDFLISSSVDICRNLPHATEDERGLNKWLELRTLEMIDEFIPSDALGDQGDAYRAENPDAPA